jgi:hypothetical protein
MFRVLKARNAILVRPQMWSVLECCVGRLPVLGQRFWPDEINYPSSALWNGYGLSDGRRFGLSRLHWDWKRVVVV